MTFCNNEIIQATNNLSGSKLNILSFIFIVIGGLITLLCSLHIFGNISGVYYNIWLYNLWFIIVSIGNMLAIISLYKHKNKIALILCFVSIGLIILPIFLYFLHHFLFNFTYIIEYKNDIRFYNNLSNYLHQCIYSTFVIFLIVFINKYTNKIFLIIYLIFSGLFILINIIVLLSLIFELQFILFLGNISLLIFQFYIF